jgi:hypothetical protein
MEAFGELEPARPRTGNIPVIHAFRTGLGQPIGVDGVLRLTRPPRWLAPRPPSPERRPRENDRPSMCGHNFQTYLMRCIFPMPNFFLDHREVRLRTHFPVNTLREASGYPCGIRQNDPRQLRS